MTGKGPLSLLEILLVLLLLPFVTCFAFNPATENKTSTSMKIVKKFDSLCRKGNYEEAAEMLTDDFCFTRPMTKLDKARWLKDFPSLALPTYGEFEQGATETQITRKGTKKVLIMKVSMMETWELTEDGKIKSITGVKT